MCHLSIYDPDHSLPPGMYVDVPHLDCLLVAAPIALEGLDHLILKPKQLDGTRQPARARRVLTSSLEIHARREPLEPEGRSLLRSGRRAQVGGVAGNVCRVTVIL